MTLPHYKVINYCVVLFFHDLHIDQDDAVKTGYIHAQGSSLMGFEKPT